MKKIEALLKKMNSTSFIGKSDYCHKNYDGYFIMEYSPNKLVVRDKTPYCDNEMSVKITYDDGFNVIGFCEFRNNKTVAEYSAPDVPKVQAHGVLSRYLFCDPRYVISIGSEVKRPKIEDAPLKIKLCEENFVFNTICAYAYIYVQNNLVTSMQIRKFNEKKEIGYQRHTIVFSY